MSESVRVECDPNEFIAELDQLTKHFANVPLELVDGLIDFLDGSGELVRFESHATAGAIKITLHLLERLLEFASATRAGNV